MKEIEQRIAIAEACGWQTSPNGKWWSHPEGTKLDRLDNGIPDYLNDLNAMHEAINTLSGNDLEKFANELARITYGGGEWHGDFTTLAVMDMLQATAAQYARAFLETLGLRKP